MLKVQEVKLQRISPPRYLWFAQFYFIAHHPLLWRKNDKRSPSILIPVGEDGHLPFQGVDSKMNQVEK